jgi:hypothetical protein
LTGSDLWLSLELLIDDLLNPSTADIPQLVFRLIVAALLLWGGFLFMRVFLTVTGKLLREFLLPPLRLLWRVVSYPFRLPYRLFRRVRLFVGRRRAARQYAMAEIARLENERREREDADRRERERLATLERILRPD